MNLLVYNMKNLILTSLKAKYPVVSDAVLNRIADKLAKTVTKEDEIEAAVEAVSFQQVLESYGDSRATEAQQSAIANYEKKHGLKDGAKVEAGGGGQQNQQQQQGGEQEQQGQQAKSDETPAWARTIIEDNKALRGEILAMKGEKTANSRKIELDKILKDAPEKIRQRYEKDFARMNFKDDEDFNVWIGEITPDVEAITTEFNTRGGLVTRPKGGSGGGQGNNEVSSHLKARISEKEAAMSAPAIQGLQTPTENK